MLVTLKHVLQLCEEKKCAAGAFNTPNLEGMLAVIGAAEELKIPVIIQHAETHDGFLPLDTVGPIMVDMAEKSTVPVCVHLDHGCHMDYIQKGLSLGFTSVMYDGSLLSLEENIANTKKVVTLAGQTGASVEAEIGCMGKGESGSSDPAEEGPEKIYTDPAEAKIFAEAAGIDALACSFGTTHGVYESEPRLDFSVVERVREATGLPVVMHGGSGVSEEDYRRAIRAGVRKINYFTYMDMAGGREVLEEIKKGTPMYHDIVTWGIRGMRKNCLEAMKVFSMY